MARRQYKTPFAATGDVVSVPDAVQPDGSVSLQQGYGFDYQRDPDTDPLAKVFPRDVHNGILNEITASIGEIQQQGYPIWVTVGAPYPINSVVRHNDANWQSTIATNNDEPGVGAGATSWKNTNQTIPSGIVTGGIAGAFSNLKASATGLSALVTVTASALCLKNAANEPVVLNSLSVTPSLAVSGVNGLDSGVSAANTWYSVWVIWNGTTTAGLFSLSSVSPTMPAGYTHRARVGWVRSDSTGNKYPLAFLQFGRNVQYVVAAGTNVPVGRQMATGSAGNVSTPTWVAVAISNFVPTTAARIRGVLSPGSSTSSALICAPNNAYGGYGSAANPPPVAVNTSAGIIAANTPFDFAIESANIYWASAAAAGVLLVMGWEDNI